jgi:DNA-binding XRE family transcriptional regulator
MAAARTWLGISQTELALAANVAKRTIVHFEAGGRVPQERTLRDLRAALEAMGVEFLMEDGIGVGIRVVKPVLLPVILDARDTKFAAKKPAPDKPSGTRA